MKNKKPKEKCEIDILGEKVINLLFALDKQKIRELLQVLIEGLAIIEVNKRRQNSKSHLVAYWEEEARRSLWEKQDN